MTEPIYIEVPKVKEKETETNTETTTTFDSNLKNDVYENIIYGFIKNEIKDNIIWEKRWKTISLTFTILKYVCLVSVPVFSLSSPYFYNYSVLLSYLSGSLASISLGFERLAKLSFNISKSKQEKINELMKKLNINFKINDVEIRTNDTKENIMTPKNLKRNFSMN